MNSGKPSAVICDMDGTLCDCSKRRHYVEGAKPDWDAFYAHVLDDRPRKNTIKMLMALRRQHSIVIVTGRPARCMGDTRKWLKQYGVRYIQLWSRADDDYREDSIIKEEIYHRSIEPIYDVVKVIDDRPQVIRMWKQLGLTVHDVGNGIEF